MFRLIRSLISLGLLAGIVYVAIFVPLGERTLWQHLKAIAGSAESKRLVDGVKHKADEVVGEGKKKAAVKPVVKGAPATRVTSRPAPEPQGKGDGFTPKERDALRKLIRSRLHPKRATEK